MLTYHTFYTMSTSYILQPYFISSEIEHRKSFRKLRISAHNLIIENVGTQISIENNRYNLQQIEYEIHFVDKGIKC